MTNVDVEIGRARKVVLCLAAVVVAGACTVSLAAADPLKCQRAIGKASSGLAQARLKALAKCEEMKLKGKLPASTTCSGEPKTAAALTKADDKLAAAVAKGCGGADKACGGGDDDSIDAIAWPHACPEFEGLVCNNAIADCGGIATCLQCIDQHAVDQAVTLYYGSLAPTSPGDPLAACQIAIGKSTSKFFAAKLKAIAKCWDLRLTGKHGDACPDAAAPRDRRHGRPPRSRAELNGVKGICKAVVVRTGCVTAPPIWSRPRSDSPPRVPRSPPAAPASRHFDLVTCVDCVTEFKVDCASALAIPPSPLTRACACRR
jgi:hypothetical protein